MGYQIANGKTPEEVLQKVEQRDLSLVHGQGIQHLADGSGYFMLVIGESTEEVDTCHYDRNTLAALLDRFGRKAAEQEFLDPKSDDTIESILGLPDKEEILKGFGTSGVPTTAEKYDLSSQALFNVYDFTHKELRVAVGYSGGSELNDRVVQGLGLENVVELKTLLGHYSGELKIGDSLE